MSHFGCRLAYSVLLLITYLLLQNTEKCLFLSPVPWYPCILSVQHLSLEELWSYMKNQMTLDEDRIHKVANQGTLDQGLHAASLDSLRHREPASQKKLYGRSSLDRPVRVELSKLFGRLPVTSTLKFLLAGDFPSDIGALERDCCIVIFGTLHLFCKLQNQKKQRRTLYAGVSLRTVKKVEHNVLQSINYSKAKEGKIFSHFTKSSYYQLQ